MSAKVSVILAVYNVEKYIRKTLDSVVNQTMRDIEIIVVDNKSTDNTLKIVEEYAKKELTLPMRTLTCTVCVKNGKRPLVSAKTKGEIPKDLLLDAMQYVRRLVIKAPVTAGQIIDSDFLQTGVPLIAVEDIPCADD